MRKKFNKNISFIKSRNTNKILNKNLTSNSQDFHFIFRFFSGKSNICFDVQWNANTFDKEVILMEISLLSVHIIWLCNIFLLLERFTYTFSSTYSASVFVHSNLNDITSNTLKVLKLKDHMHDGNWKCLLTKAIFYAGDFQNSCQKVDGFFFYLSKTVFIWMLICRWRSKWVNGILKEPSAN